MDYKKIFWMPKAVSVSGRSSSLTAAFVSAIIPVVVPSESEIEMALSILELDSADLRCSYCGDKASEWDHLRPLVHKRQPTGFISEIRNLVPSCGKCNQSKGNKGWREWMLGDARHSPRRRGVSDIGRKIGRLEKFVAWGKVEGFRLESLAEPPDWKEHWENWQRVQDLLSAAQKLAARIRESIARGMTRQRAGHDSVEPAIGVNPPSEARRPPIAAYRYSRLCFKAKVIEPLRGTDCFRVQTPVGTFEFTKDEFYRDFQNVIASRSYKERGIYHFPRLPAVAEKYRASA